MFDLNANDSQWWTLWATHMFNSPRNPPKPKVTPLPTCAPRAIWHNALMTTTPPSPIPFIDLASQYARLKTDIDARIHAVLDHNQYILGEEVRDLEAALSAYCGASHTISCANGTDALILPLKAWRVRAGDAVFVPSWSYCASAEAVALLGATPVFVDIDPRTYNMSAQSLRAAIAGCPDHLTPRVVMSVDLFGQSADYDAIAPIAREHGLKLLADCAQGFGTTWDGHHPIHWADAVTTSFFPAKPLGCYGDGGAVMTHDAALDAELRSLRMHGAGTDKYDNVRVGLNSRLDTIQAAVLLSKLSVFDDEIAARQRVADRYADGLRGVVDVPFVAQEARSTWAIYTVATDAPDALQKALGAAGVPAPRYYPKPIHRQTAYADYPVGAGGLDATDAARLRAISLPMHPYLGTADQDRVVQALQDTGG